MVLREKVKQKADLSGRHAGCHISNHPTQSPEKLTWEPQQQPTYIHRCRRRCRYRRRYRYRRRHRRRLRVLRENTHKHNTHPTRPASSSVQDATIVLHARSHVAALPLTWLDSATVSRARLLSPRLLNNRLVSFC